MRRKLLKYRTELEFMDRSTLWMGMAKNDANLEPTINNILSSIGSNLSLLDALMKNSETEGFEENEQYNLQFSQFEHAYQKLLDDCKGLLNESNYLKQP